MSKSILGAVGLSAKNAPPTDVMTIQYLLNCVPPSQGGPQPELAVDGICGPLTVAAIRRFQQHWLGWADGRVDPGGKTIGALQPFDPYPNEPFQASWVGGKFGGGPVAGKQAPVAGKWGGKPGAPTQPAGKLGGTGAQGSTTALKSGSAAPGKVVPGLKGV